MKRTNLVWLIPLAIVLALGGFALGLVGWCGDDALGCRFGPGQAASTIGLGLVLILLVASALFALFSGVSWGPTDRMRRRWGLVIAVSYLVAVACYIVLTALIPRSP